MNKVLLFLSQGFEEAEAAAFIDVFGWSRVVKGVKPVELVVVGLDNQIKATHNLVVRPQKLLKEVKLDEFSAFCMPGGFHARGFMQAYNDEVLAAIKYIHKNGGIIATICTAALPVAKTGLLKGKKVTTYPLTPEVTDRDNLAILKEYGACFVKEEIVVDNRIITSSGPGTCYKVAFKLLELL